MPKFSFADLSRMSKSNHTTEDIASFVYNIFGSKNNVFLGWNGIITYKDGYTTRTWGGPFWTMKDCLGSIDSTTKFWFCPGLKSKTARDMVISVGKVELGSSYDYFASDHIESEVLHDFLGFPYADMEGHMDNDEEGDYDGDE